MYESKHLLKLNFSESLPEWLKDLNYVFHILSLANWAYQAFKKLIVAFPYLMVPSVWLFVDVYYRTKESLPRMLRNIFESILKLQINRALGFSVKSKKAHVYYQLSLYWTDRLEIIVEVPL